MYVTDILKYFKAYSCMGVGDKPLRQSHGHWAQNHSLRPRAYCSVHIENRVNTFK